MISGRGDERKMTGKGTLQILGNFTKYRKLCVRKCPVLVPISNQVLLLGCLLQGTREEKTRVYIQLTTYNDLEIALTMTKK